MNLELSGFLSAIIGAGGGGAIIAYFAFKKFGESWLDSKFAEKLEAFRHERAKEIERLRADIDGSLRARIRLQEKEFESLSECWHLMNVAYGAAQAFLSPYQQYQDINRMSADMRREFVSKLEIYDSQKSEILSSSDPFKEYTSTVRLMKNNVANRAINEFNNRVYRDDIFLDEKISDAFKAVLKSMRSAVLNMEIGHDEAERTLRKEAWEQLKNECHPLISDLTRTLRHRIDGRATLQ